MTLALTEQVDLVARGLEGGISNVIQILDLAEHADDRRGVDRSIGVLVVETDVTPCYRGLKSPAGIGDASDRFPELPEDLRFIGVTEVQAVRDGDWLGADADDIPGALRNG